MIPSSLTPLEVGADAVRNQKMSNATTSATGKRRIAQSTGGTAENRVGVPRLEQGKIGTLIMAPGFLDIGNG